MYSKAIGKQKFSSKAKVKRHYENIILMVNLHLFAFLNGKQRRKSYSLLCLMVIGMLLETIGISLVLPVLALLSDGDSIANNATLSPLLVFLNNPSRSELVAGSMIVLCGLYILKTLFLIYLASQQSRFVFDLNVSLSNQLFSGYLRQHYSFHLQRNSAELIRNVTNEVSQTTSAILAVTNILAEALVLGGVAILLVLIEPIGSMIVMVVLSAAAYIFHRICRPFVYRWGKLRQEHDGKLVQHLQQGLGGVKDVKVLGRENYFISQYSLRAFGSALMGQRINLLLALPRLWLDLLAVIGLVALVLSMLAQSKPLEAILPILGVFAAAAFRLLPSINRILLGMQTLRYAVPAISTIYNELKLADVGESLRRTEMIQLNSAIEIKSLSYSYPQSSTSALCGLNAVISRGETVGFIGESGAGKSTLVDIILGLLTPTRGLVLVDGVDIQENIRSWQSQIGYVPQTVYLTDDSLKNNVAFGVPSHEIDSRAVEAAIDAVQLRAFVDSLPEGINTLVGERGVRISGGQRQRIGIARALYRDPPVLVLDEATSALDNATEQDVMEAVRKLQGRKTLLIVAHRLSTVKQCDRLYCLEHGRIAAVDDLTRSQIMQFAARY